jgi:hypothetical protein
MRAGRAKAARHRKARVFILSVVSRLHFNESNACAGPPYVLMVATLGPGFSFGRRGSLHRLAGAGLLCLAYHRPQRQWKQQRPTTRCESACCNLHLPSLGAGCESMLMGAGKVSDYVTTHTTSSQHQIASPPRNQPQPTQPALQLPPSLATPKWGPKVLAAKGAVVMGTTHSGQQSLCPRPHPHPIGS